MPLTSRNLARLFCVIVYLILEESALALPAPVDPLEDTDTLMPGQTLQRGLYIISPNRQYKLIMQSDGSLVMYRADGSVRYRMKKYGSYAIMQNDGNFVEYAGSTSIWATSTNTSPGYWLVIHDDGDLSIEWSTPSHSLFIVPWHIGADPYGDPTIISYPMTPVPPPGIPPRCPFRADYVPPPGC